MQITDSKNIDRLYIGDKEIILLGTAHVSKESTRLVTEVIEAEKPDTVCVELCESRFQSIRQKDRWQNMDIIKVIKEKKAFLLLSNLMLASFQKRVAEKLEVKPGEEMIKAIESAEAVNAQIIMADRDIRVTLLRTWRIMGLWSRAKILFQLMLSMVGGLDEISAEDVEKMKQADILETLLADVGKAFPVLRNVLIDERDRYLSHKIKTAPGKKIVAVVGAGHVPGIRKYWDSDTDISALEEIPSPGKLVGILKWLFPSAILLLFVFGFFRGGAGAGKEMIIWWVLAHGILASLGSLAAMAHPLTILSSFMVSPLTSLNPMIAAGWVSGLVEAFLRQPKVWDFENLSDDVMSVKGFWKNKVTRILLVVVFTNMGSAAGTYMAIPLMVRAMG